MQKRGELTLQIIILLILAVIVLITVLWIFQDQIAGVIDALSGTSDTVTGDLDKAADGLTP